MKTDIKNRNKVINEWHVMGVFFLILLCLHLLLKTGWGDDATFAGKTMPLRDFLTDRYRTWTSRLIIEAGVKLLASSPAWVWKVLNTLMILLLVWIIADLFGVEDKETKEKIWSQIFFFSLLWCLPVRSLCDAGWIATTINYLWPLTLGLVAMRPIKHWLAKERCPVWEYPVCPACIICAANMEQGAAVLLGVYLLSGVYLFLKNRKLPFFYCLLLLCVMVSVLFILLTPGNACRFTVEMNQWFPGFGDLNLFEKMLIGFIDSMNYYASAGGGERKNYIFALLTGILSAGILQKRMKDRLQLKTITAFLPFLFYWGIGQMGNGMLQVNMFWRGGHIVGLFGKNRCLPTGAGTFDYLGWIAYSRKMVLLQAGIYLGLVICVTLTIYFIHGKSKETLLELVILGSGLCSRIIMGFSPTIYASGERTSLYCSVAVLIVCMRNLQFYRNGWTQKKEKMVLGIYIIVVICVSIWSSKEAMAGRVLL